MTTYGISGLCTCLNIDYQYSSLYSEEQWVYVEPFSKLKMKVVTRSVYFSRDPIYDYLNDNDFYEWHL